MRNASGYLKGLASLRNDLVLQYHTVQRIIERLEQIEALPRESAVYQSALDDIRGVIREMPRPGAACRSGGGCGVVRAVFPTRPWIAAMARAT